MGSLLWLFIKLINQGLLQYLSVKLICSWSALKGLCRSGRWWFMMLPDAVEQSITSMTYKLYRFRRARPSSWSCLCILWLSYLEWVDYIKLTLTMIMAFPFPFQTHRLHSSCHSHVWVGILVMRLDWYQKFHMRIVLTATAIKCSLLLWWWSVSIEFGTNGISCVLNWLLKFLKPKNRNSFILIPEQCLLYFV